MEDDRVKEQTKRSGTELKKTERLIWVIARNIEDPAWSEP